MKAISAAYLLTWSAAGAVLEEAGSTSSFPSATV
jgi:hypothetical protein